MLENKKPSKISVPLVVSDKEILVNIFNSSLTELEKNKVAQDVIDKYPGVYCFYNKDSIYIGESNHPFKRLKEHMGNRRFTPNDRIIVFRSEQFHKSAIYDIETNLIDHVGSEHKLSLRNVKDNQKSYEYFLKYAYADVFKQIWKYLIDNNLSDKSLEDIQKSEEFKFSPYKSLNSGQSTAVESVEKSVNTTEGKITVIEGYPGTGKSIVASRLYKSQSQKYDVCLTSGSIHIAESFKRVFKLHNKTINTNSKIMKTSQLFNSDENFDLVIVDEAHKLSRKSGRGHGMKYNHIDNGSDELDMLVKKYKNIVLLYDANQKSHDDDVLVDFNKYKNVEFVKLDEQMRSQEGYEYINWTVNWLNGKFNEIEKDKYDFRFYDSFKNLYTDLKEKSEEHPQTRLISGYTRKWVSKNDPSKYDFDIDGIKLKWNNVKAASSSKWLDSYPARQLREVTYYHVIQGFDLDYAGIIVGEDIYLDENDEIQVNKDYVMHRNQLPGAKSEDFYSELKSMIINRYKILLSRGVKGAYIYVEDERLRNKLKSLLK